MATKTTSAKRKPEPATETSQSLAAQMAAFIKAGGEVQTIPNGKPASPSLRKWPLSSRQAAKSRPSPTV